MGDPKVLLSWLVLICGAVFGFSVGSSDPAIVDPLAAALVWGYGCWGFFWVAPPVWRWWCRLPLRHDPTSLRGWALGAMLTLLLPVLGGFLFGFFGGGFYYFLKHKRHRRLST